jgi:hypothetical protein
MKATVNDPVHELKAVLAEHLPWHGARIGFLAQFLLALFKVRSVNLAELATGFWRYGPSGLALQAPATLLPLVQDRPGFLGAALGTPRPGR